MKISANQGIKLAATAILASVATTGISAPTAYSTKYDASDVKQVSNASFLRDSETEDLVWVLPPTAGNASLTGFAPSANLRFCEGLKSLTNASNSLAKRFENLQTRFDADLVRLDQAEKDLIAEREAKKAIANASTSAKDMIFLDEAIEVAEQERDDILADLDLCVIDEVCTGLIEEYGLVRDRLKGLKAERDQLARENRDIDRQLRAADRKILVAEDIFLDVGRATEAMAERIVTLDSTIQTAYANRGKLEGGFASVLYDTGWDAAVEDLSLANPNYNFQKVRTENARIFANLIGTSDSVSYYESLPALLDYTIDGHKFLPEGETTIGDAETSLPSVINGTMRLSLIGGCPVADRGFFDDLGFKMREDLNGDPVFSISATYMYPAAYKYRVEASYNLYKFYEIIKKTGTRGGFFSSKSYSKVSETRVDEDVFKIDWDIQDMQFTATEKAQIRTDLKTDLMNRVLVTMAEPVSANAPSLPLDPPGSVPEPGSLVLAKGLEKTCGFNFYCRAGSWILKGAQAIWGSSRSEQSFKTTWDRTATEIWSSKDVRLTPGATSFRQQR
ncbi:MAG: hypothetical protein HRU19_02695 [Pseudobacteriovorax sp.]|nr:hypothetical protein [Pseudobacteriovorax sp.]